MDCSNSTVTEAIGVFFGCVRGQSEVTGKMLVHRGMVYVIEGDIVLLSKAALKDLGLIPQSFPTIGEFGEVQQIGNGRDNLQIDSNLNVKYIAADYSEVAEDPNLDEGDVHDVIPAASIEIAVEAPSLRAMELMRKFTLSIQR